MNKHTATYSVFGLSDEKGPQFIKTKQSLFETLILLFSQIEVNDKDWVFDELADDIEEIYGIDVRDEKQLHGLGLILDLNESDNDRVGIDLDCSGDCREFKLWLRQQEEAIFAEQQQELDEIGRRMRLAYEAVYHSDFDTDCKLDRVETNKRVQAISELWVTDYVVA